MHPRLARFRLLTGPVLMATAAAMLLVPAGPATAKPAPGCAAGGVKVSAGASPTTVSVTDTTTGTGTQVVVTVSGTDFTIDSATGALTNASWCLKAGSQTQNGTGTFGTSAVVNKKGAPQAIALLVVYNVTSPFAGARAICAKAPRSRGLSGCCRRTVPTTGPAPSMSSPTWTSSRPSSSSRRSKPSA